MPRRRKRSKKYRPYRPRKPKHQIGKSVIRLDRKRPAKQPGRRPSPSGGYYYEYRANRSDMDRRKRL